MTNYPDPIDPALLDLVMRENDHTIYYADKVLLTPAGNELADRDVRLLKHLLVKLTIYGRIELHSVNSFSLFCFQRDYIMAGKDPIRQEFQSNFMQDPLVMLRLGKGSSLLDVAGALAYLEDHPALLNLIFWGMPEIARRLTSFLDEISRGKGDEVNSIDDLQRLIKEAYEGLLDAQKTGVNLLSKLHASGIILPLMMVKGKVSPSEYATAVLAINLRKAMMGEEIPPIQLFNQQLSPIYVDQSEPGKTFQDIHQQTIRGMEFMSFYTGLNNRLEPSIRDLIGTGESYNLEFKTSLRWDVRQQKKNPAIEHASLKTICAFLNSSGGHLLIGVEDDGRVEGLEIDKFENDDKFLLHFWNLIKSSMGQEVTPFIQTKLEKIDGGTVCHVKCLRSPAPVFLRQKGFDEEFYIRTGPSSASLEIREALQYIKERFADSGKR